MIIPTLVSQAPGNPITSALWNGTVVGGLQAAQNPVMFKGYATAQQTITSSTGGTNLVLLDSEEYDTDGAHSTTTNTSRFTCQTAGVYLCWGCWTTAETNTTGTRAAEIFKNGAQTPGSLTQLPATASNGATVCTPVVGIRLIVGDYVELNVWQNSGSTLHTSSSSVRTYSVLTTMRVSN
jgi:hypothetical protein